MKSFNIILQAPQVCLKKENTIAIRGTLCYATVVLGIVALLIGCPDSMGDDNGDDNGTPTQATLVQGVLSDNILATSITLHWSIPTDTDGYLGVTISEESNSGSLSEPATEGAKTTTHTVTTLAAATKYTFSIATRYTASGKNNHATITVTTLGVPTDANKVQSAPSSAITTNAITLNWTLPTDTAGFLGVTISEEDNSGSLSAPAEIAADTTTYEVTNLESATEYAFTIATRYIDSGKNNSITIVSTTAATTTVRRVGINNGTTTSDSVTISWTDPIDIENYTEVLVSISADPPVGDIPPQRILASDPNILTISGLAAETPYTLMLTFATEYSDGKNGTSSEHIIDVTLQSNRVTAVVTSTIDHTSITLSWADPEDRVRYSGVAISANPAEGSLSSEITIAATAGSTVQQLAVTGLTVGFEYVFTLTTQYDNDVAGNNKSGGDTTFIATTTRDPVDADGNNLIDINSLEHLNNIRHNLDLSDGRYKRSSGDSGIQCGTAEDTNCIGYELTRNLDFTDNSSYQSGMVNNDWRPQDSSGMVLTQENASDATNPGWEPIGSCNADATDTDNLICGDDNDTPFAVRFEGNGYTVSKLYARNTSTSTGAAIGLLGAIGSTATINTVGMVDAAVYGSSAGFDNIGGLVGFNRGDISTSYAIGSIADGSVGTTDFVGGLVGSNDGNITASYATATADGGMGANDSVGGLVGHSNGTIIASYATATTDGGMGNSDAVGGLVGYSTGNIIASYATGSTANGGMGNSDAVGGLVGYSTGNIIASYATGSTADGGADNTDDVGGLVGSNINPGTIVASYATNGTADGGTGNNDSVGGLVGSNLNIGSIVASYAATTADGGTGTNNSVGNLVGVNSFEITVTNPPQILSGTIIASYGFGTTANVDTAGLSEGPDGRPTDGTVDSTTGSTGAALLLAPDSSDSTNTAVDAAWNQASSNTAGAWHFGGAIDIPVLRYADYDGPDNNTYGCGSGSTATIVIPDSVPNGAGGTTTVTCDTTLLPGQR